MMQGEEGYRSKGAGFVSESRFPLYVQYVGGESAQVWDILLDSLL